MFMEGINLNGYEKVDNSLLHGHITTTTNINNMMGNTDTKTISIRCILIMNTTTSIMLVITTTTVTPVIRSPTKVSQTNDQFRHCGPV